MIDNLLFHIPPIETARQIEIAAEMKVGCEVNIDSRVIDNVNIDNILLMTRNCKKIHTHGPFMDINQGSLDTVIRRTAKERILQAINLSYQIGSECVIFHSGYNPLYYSTIKNLWIDNAVKFWNDIFEEGFWEKIESTNNFTVCIENHFEETMDILLEIFERVSNKRLKCCFDLSHSYLYSLTDIISNMKTLRNYIKEIHINDTDGNRDTHQVIGTGILNIKEILSCVDDFLFNPYLTIEVLSEESACSSLAFLEAIYN